MVERIKMLSYKIMKIEEFDDAVFYRIACECGSKEHDFDLWLEYDEDINDISMIISKEVYWSACYTSWPWYEKIWKRFLAVIKLTFCGHLKMEADVLFNKPEHIKGFIEALNGGLIKLEDKDNKKSD